MKLSNSGISEERSTGQRAQRKHGAEGHDGGVRLTTNHGLLRSHCHMEEHSHIPPPNVYCAKHCESGERNKKKRI